jgi:hypothetical protein
MFILLYFRVRDWSLYISCIVQRVRVPSAGRRTRVADLQLQVYQEASNHNAMGLSAVCTSGTENAPVRTYHSSTRCVGFILQASHRRLVTL